jgi:hypothetical protein
MSIQLIGFICAKGITSLGIMYLLKYFTDSRSDDQQKMDYLFSKICNLERQINELNQTIDDMEEKYIKKENTMIKSTCELNDRLEEFINYNYNILE